MQTQGKNTCIPSLSLDERELMSYLAVTKQGPEESSRILVDVFDRTNGLFSQINRTGALSRDLTPWIVLQNEGFLRTSETLFFLWTPYVRLYSVFLHNEGVLVAQKHVFNEAVRSN